MSFVLCYKVLSGGFLRTLREALQVRGIAIDGNRQDRDPFTAEASTDFALYLLSFANDQ
ncbi:hypothetical protein [Nostoc sp. PA-18-2419]|uniref:hypothetical protein n=1 Tax=Nostoc sp. PA-18-2419 TaxID=2575443 RepID=UPI0016735F87|nr:hypothetical protein [Nostoc sp. PA-18-2419]